MSISDDMGKRYSSIDELLATARRDTKVIRHNSLAGVFVWLPDDFEIERAANTFPANADAANYWLHDANDCWRGYAKDIERLQFEIEAKQAEADAIWRYAHATG